MTVPSVADGPPVGDGPSWVTLADGSASPPARRLPSPRRVASVVVAAGLAVLVVVGVVASYASSQLASRDAAAAGVQVADLLADTVIGPAVTANVLAGEPDSLDWLDSVVHDRVFRHGVVELKLYAADGTIVYADDRTQIGQRFVLDPDQQRVLAQPHAAAVPVESGQPDSGPGHRSDRLLEVRRSLSARSGQRLLLELYVDYETVRPLAASLWRAMMGLLFGSVVLMVLLLSPVLWQVLRRLREEGKHRERLLQRTVDASTQERQRLAGTLHDGPVQELAGSALTISGAAERLQAAGQLELASHVREAGATVRRCVGGLRTLLVDLYPPSLQEEGLQVALLDVLASLEGHGVAVSTDLDPAAIDLLTQEDQRLVHRVVSEGVRNIAKHARAGRVNLSIRLAGDDVVVTLTDDGIGFEPGVGRARALSGHVGLSVVRDLAAQARARVELATAPGAGTALRLIVPTRTER